MGEEQEGGRETRHTCIDNIQVCMYICIYLEGSYRVMTHN